MKVSVLLIVTPSKIIFFGFNWVGFQATFKIWFFYFSQILTEIVEKQHALTPFNYFSKFSHCLSLFPMFLVHANWIVFCVTAHLFKFCNLHILRSNESWAWSNNSVWIWKMIVNETGDHAKAAVFQNRCS